MIDDGSPGSSAGTASGTPAGDHEVASTPKTPTSRPAVKSTRVRMTAAARRGSILEAARSAFITSGFAGTRTRDIAERAGVNEALLFQHFASKEAIFQEAVIDKLLEIMETSLVPEQTAQHGTALDRRYASTCATMRGLLEVMQRAVPLLGVVLFADSERAKTLYREQITPILDAGAARLRRNYGTWEHRDYDPDVMSRASTGMCLFIALDAYFAGRELDLDATAAELASIVVYGSAARSDGPAAATRGRRRRPGSPSR